VQEKTTALVSAQAARSRAEEQAAQLQVQLQAQQVAERQSLARQRAAEQRSEPGAMVPAGKWRELVLELEEVQRRYDALEQQHAALQHRVPPSRELPGSAAGEESAAGAQSPDPAIGCGTLQAAAASRAYCPRQYSGSPGPANSAAAAQGGQDLAAQLLEKDVQLFDAHLQRDQAAAEAERHRRRLHSLLDSLSPHAADEAAAASIAEARQLAGLPPPPSEARAARAAAGAKPTGTGRAGGGASKVSGRRQQPSAREQELLSTVELLKGALERAQKGLQSGVTSAKYMQVGTTAWVACMQSRACRVCHSRAPSITRAAQPMLRPARETSGILCRLSSAASNSRRSAPLFRSSWRMLRGCERSLPACSSSWGRCRACTRRSRAS
jgi:hypothetical protein